MDPPHDSAVSCLSTGESSSCPEAEQSVDIQSRALNHVVGNNPMVVFVHQYSIMGGSRRTLTGHKETEDVVAACSWCVKYLKAQNIVIVGSSAGAPIGGSAVEQLQEIRGYVGIGYVFGLAASVLFRGHYKKILQSSKPKLFIHGDEDGFTSTSTFISYFNSAEKPKEKRIIPMVGHFEMEGPAYDSFMATEIVKFIDKYLPASVQPASTAVSAAPPTGKS
ncbi:hypothetical protein, conserved [Eimeria praecox]|uniref:Peptidase S9 prolyl oligopeptidase catalytic domain-containing protein n=1 Tax=Eimeria praecox TaxID=51316 RepID=U6H4G2_9EIME|nr:hypothetical protein, conserved [Eimeria praecox]